MMMEGWFLSRSTMRWPRSMKENVQRGSVQGQPP